MNTDMLKMERLMQKSLKNFKKFEGADKFLPKPIFKQKTNASSKGLIYFGSTEAAMQISRSTFCFRFPN